MSDAVTLIKAFAKKRISFQQLNAELARMAIEDTDSIPDLLRVLARAKQAGLPDRVYRRLNGAVRTAEQISLRPEPSDWSKLAGSNGGGETVVLSTSPLVTGVSPSDPPADNDLSDVTDVPTIPPSDGAGDPADVEATEINPREPDPTHYIPPPRGTDATSVSGGGWASAGGPSDVGAQGDEEFFPGSMLRGRFRLLSKLGEGGMGTVWKAIDLLKEEARDRNPFVAIKLLQVDFKDHPEAFIALQRETAKQQRLAHPNIATVHDFDREDVSGTVYMTMEVLEGDDLSAFIRRLPKGGLPFEEAMPLIEQLSAGLAYAHENQLVHADLKPGNCFITEDRTVKLLDFGIARASKTRSDAEGETTIFDPGELGALTPTYATIEMFEGMDPDPRDDIYALAIIAHQLLTGKHPYDRKSAPVAMEMLLKPAPVAKLNKAQNRALAHGLALMREDRVPSVQAFLDGLRPKKSYARQRTAAAIAGLVIAGTLAYAPIRDHIQGERNETIIRQIATRVPEQMAAGLAAAGAFRNPARAAALRDEPRVRAALIGLLSQGTESSIKQGLALLAPYPEDWQKSIKDEEAVRRAIFAHYTQAVEPVVDDNSRAFDYPLAEQALDELAGIYVDSAEVLRLRQDLQKRKDEALTAQDSRFNKLLEAGALIPEADRPDREHIGDPLRIIASISPEHPLLTDPRIGYRFQELISGAMVANDEGALERAKRLLEAARTYAPDDASLANLRYQVNRELKRRRDKATIAALEGRLRPLVGENPPLARFDAVRDEIAFLAGVSPDNHLLGKISSRLRKTFDRTVAVALEAKDWNAASERLKRFAPILEVDHISKTFTKIAAAQGPSAPPVGSSQTAISERVGDIKEQLEAPDSLSEEWERGLTRPYRELLAVAGPAHPAVRALQTELAEGYAGQARAAREREQLAEAEALLRRGGLFFVDHPLIAKEHLAVIEARRDLEKRRAAEQRLARLEGLKRSLIAKAQANQTQDAEALLEQLKPLVNSDNPFIRSDAPRAIGAAYGRLAATSAEQGDWSAAVKLGRAALDVSGQDPALEEVHKRYQGELKKAEALIALRARLAGETALTAADLNRSLDAVKRDYPEQFPRIMGELAEQARTGLSGRTLTSPLQVAQLGRDLAVLESTFRSRLNGLRADLGRQLQTVVERRQRTNATQARALLSAAQTAFPDDQGLASIKVVVPAKPSPLAEKGEREVAAGNLTAASQVLEQVLEREPDAANVEVFRNALASRQREAMRAFDRYRRAMEARREREARDHLGQARAAWRDNPDPAWRPARNRKRLARGICDPALAGLGKRRGTCYDKIGSARGPLLVVVPEGAGSPVFAIGKFEITIGEFNAYCKASGRCVPHGGNPKIPVTGITVQEATGYAQWLSQETKQVYRLPTPGEWDYAARARGQQPKKNFNCTVKLGAKVIKGQDLVNARSGESNGWGLTNYVGNAQEWVQTGDSVAVRGGSHADPLSKCDLSLSRKHGGDGDSVTGFRIVRELG